MMILNLIPRDNRYNDQVKELSYVIKSTLSEETYTKVFGKYDSLNLDYIDIFNFFITTVVEKDDLLRMFNKVEVQEGSDWEDEWVATLKINGRIVLLLASPERGSSIRIEGDDYLPMSDIKSIIEQLCIFYNENF
jgi:hypothetical protein